MPQSNEAELRRRIAGAKSYLSRLHNQLESVQRSSRPDRQAEHRRLYDLCVAQESKFRALCQQLREMKES